VLQRDEHWHTASALSFTAAAASRRLNTFVTSSRRGCQAIDPRGFFSGTDAAAAPSLRLHPGASNKHARSPELIR